MKYYKQPSEPEWQAPDSHEPASHLCTDDWQERTRREQLQVETLMAEGFFWEEAIKLVQMREHIGENVEAKQRLEDNDYMQFAQWLYRCKIMNEGEES